MTSAGSRTCVHKSSPSMSRVRQFAMSPRTPVWVSLPRGLSARCPWTTGDPRRVPTRGAHPVRAAWTLHATTSPFNPPPPLPWSLPLISTNLSDAPVKTVETPAECTKQNSVQKNDIPQNPRMHAPKLTSSSDISSSTRLSILQKMFSTNC